MSSPSKTRCSSGFTLIELVVVIVVSAILAAVAYNRINITAFDTDGYAGKLRATVRYAQKLAVTQRRPICVQSAGNAVALLYGAACGGGAVTEPPHSTPFQASAPSGVTVSSSPALFYFDSLGRPNPAATLTILGNGSRTITVEAETGFVH